MLRLIIFFLIIFISSFGFSESQLVKSFKEQVLSAPKTKALKVDEIVVGCVNSTLEQAQSGEIILGAGRQSLLQEMLKEPKQLGKDLLRIPTIKIGQSTVLSSWRITNNAEQQFSLISKLLTKYIIKHKPEFVDKKNHIGPFGVEEIIYGIVQNFSGLALDLAYEHPLLKSHEWAPVAGSAQQQASFALESPQHPILVASFISKRNLLKPEDIKKKGPKLITISKLYFDLLSGDVSFYYSYSIDDTGSARIIRVLP